MSSIPKWLRWVSIYMNGPLYVYLGNELAEEKSFMLEQILSDNSKHIMKLTESHNQEMEVKFLFVKLYFWHFWKPKTIEGISAILEVLN